jgi:hypothetical protein
MYSRAWMALKALKAQNAPCTPVSRPEQRNPMSSVALSLGGRQGTNSAGLGASDANGQINYNVARLKKAARRVDQLTRLSPFFDPKFSEEILQTVHLHLARDSEPSISVYI